ncbi:MAG: aldehyde ferredoxin oxidoreductase family protein [Candidatus Methanospirareceae archaeon]
MKGGAEMNRVLYVDLTKKAFKIEERDDLFDKYLGGVGVGIKLLEEECERGIDPLSPSNPIILAVGPLTGLYPSASKTVALFKSPLTGNLGESHTGGRSAMAIRFAGYGAIVIKGAADIPVYLTIHGEDVHFRDASSIWGIDAQTVGRILREVEGGAGVRTIIRIGRGGERMVRYACAVCETYRHFGRLGLGAVMGSKKLKAIVISADRGVRIPKDKRRKYSEVYDSIYDAVVHSEAMKKYHDLGTAENVFPLNTLGGLPWRNLRGAKAPEEIAREFSGENFAEKLLVRRVACSHCPVGCIHLASLRELYEPGHYYKMITIPYDYETIYSLAFMLDLRKAEDYLRLIDAIDRIGLDAISTGVTLAWATEAYERGLIKEGDTDGLSFRWGDVETYMKAIEKIVEMPNEFYTSLARGVEYASSIYGGEDFALAFGGNEMPGYHTGIASYINFITGARHSHLDSAGYSLDQKLIGKEFTIEEVVRELIREEEWRQILSSLVVCFFARKIYTMEKVIEALYAIGINVTEEELKRLGREILRAKIEFKRREGFDLSKVRIPKRIFEVPTPHGILKEEDIKRALEVYEEMIKSET